VVDEGREVRSSRRKSLSMSCCCRLRVLSIHIHDELCLFVTCRTYQQVCVLTSLCLRGAVREWTNTPTVVRQAEIRMVL
jgi:hypothetical protein